MAETPLAALIVVLTLVAVLATSAVAKLQDRRATRDAFDALRVPAIVPADAAAAALPWVELALAALLLVTPDGYFVAVTVPLVLLMLAYTWIIARALGFAEPVTCSCFGSLGRHDVDIVTLARNVLLTLMALATLWYAATGGSTATAMGELVARDWWALAAAAAAAGMALLVAGGSPSSRATPTTPVDAVDYERQRIPYGSLVMPDGATMSMAELARTQARLLVILNEGCSPCIRTAEKLDGWARSLSPVVGLHAVYADESAASTSPHHDPGLGAWEREMDVRRVFAVSAPAAVLLGADGYLAGGPVQGEDEVSEFVAEILAELGAVSDVSG